MESFPSLLPVLPIRNAVLFPTTSMPLVVGRDRSLRALEIAEKTTNNLIVIVTQAVITPGDPEPKDLYRIGTIARIENKSVTEQNTTQVVVAGIARYRIAEYDLMEEGYLGVRGETVADIQTLDPVKSKALLGNLKELAREILEMLPAGSEPLAKFIERVDDPSYLTNVCAAYLNLGLAQKQQLLEETRVEKRLELLLQLMQREREVLAIQRQIRDKMTERLSKAQREALLREQLRTIRAELGDEAEDRIADEIEEKIEAAHLPEAAEKVIREELKRFRSLPTSSSEYHVVRNYLELFVSLPWSITTEDKLDLGEAKKILDQDHYGLDHVKKRILQFLAVAHLKRNLRGPILCLVGPPGVGKTSLGQSIARALGRKFIRTSLGGIRDEAEIRGHRKTYVGAMPGRIVQGIRRVGSRNPVMILDEMDKLSHDFHGDPAAALLEVLDPEQNKTFTDHYLDTSFDLSDVFFIGTANLVDSLPSALRDRLEIIEVSGYTAIEKRHIAQNYLIPKQLEEHGLSGYQVEITDAALDRLITHYTREAGVRELQRKIAGLCRVIAEEVVLKKKKPKDKVKIKPEDLKRMLGIERFQPEKGQRVMRPGVTTGLAWTAQGGDILFIEASKMPGKGGLVLTGQLGDVMKESAQIALSLAREFHPKIDFSQMDIHVHVPSGAIPKDGPSAGVTMLTSLMSMLSGKSIDPKTAMTGEITLRGAVMPVGGIKEKVLAAHRAGMKHVILPARNEQDLEEVPREVRKDLQIHFVENVDQLLKKVLTRK